MFSLTAIGDQYKTIIRRFVALIFDYVLIVPLLLLPNYFKKQGIEMGDFDLLVALLPAFYFIILHALYGQTGGKRICNIQVQHASQSRRCYWWQAVLREIIPLVILGSLISSVAFILNVNWIFVWVGFNCLVIFLNRRRRSLIDLLTNTVVVQYAETERYYNALKNPKNFPN